MKPYLYIFFGLLFCSLDAGSYAPKDYGYLIQAMPKFDQALLNVHFKLYQGYVAQVNQLDQMLQADSEKSFTYQAIKRRYGWEYDGMVLHELYFDNLGGDGKIDQTSPLYQKIVMQFGSYDNWMKDFQATALVRGVGWVILYLNPKTGTLYNAWITEHDTGPLFCDRPLLVVDLWEHAYLCQFKLDRPAYISTIFDYINWSVVSQRLTNN